MSDRKIKHILRKVIDRVDQSIRDADPSDVEDRYYRRGYQDALHDVRASLNGHIPSRRDKWWKEEDEQ